MVKLTKQQSQQIQVFREMLLEKNQSLNLISRKEPQKQWKFLLKQGVLTAELLAPVLNFAPADVLDIGCGNGFPGMLFAVLFPKKKFYLCERIRKKAELLKNIKHELALDHVQILCQPAEELNRSFGLILSQASLPLERMIKLLQKILSLQGQAFLWHSKNWKKGCLSFPSVQLEAFKTYKINTKTKVLLKAQRV